MDLWDLKSARAIRTFDPPVQPVRFQAFEFVSANRLVAVVNEFELQFLDLDTGTPTLLIDAARSIPGSPHFSLSALAVSADQRRIAVAGMRMSSRPGVFAPAGDAVFDVPVRGEVQIWDAESGKLLKTLAGRADEKFLRVALDPKGERVAAAAAGIRYRRNMSAAMQQSAELRPAQPVRISVWTSP